MRKKPDNANANWLLGRWYHSQQLLDQAIEYYNKSLEIDPANGYIQFTLGSAYCQKGQLDDAVRCLQKGAQLDPGNAEGRCILGEALLAQGRVPEAVDTFQKVLNLDPDSVEALNIFALVLATNPDDHVRDGARAVQLAEHACRLTHYQEPLPVGTLAAAYAEAGRYDEAIATSEKACDLAKQRGETDLFQKNQKLRELYRAHKPYREPHPIPVKTPS